MHHVRPPAALCGPGRKLRRQQCKGGIALGIVRPVGTAGIDIGITRTIEQGRAVDQPDRHPETPGQHFQYAKRTHRAGNRHIDGCDRARFFHRAQHVSIARQQQAHVDAELSECMWQAVAKITQPAGLDQRKQLADDMQYSHRRPFRKMAPSGGKESLRPNGSKPIHGRFCGCKGWPLPRLLPP